VKPAHPFDRPRLNLKPRSQPLAIDSKAPQAAQEQDLPSSGSSAEHMEAHRRRLNLQPRSLPLPSAAPARDAADQRPRRLHLQARSKALAGAPLAQGWQLGMGSCCGGDARTCWHTRP
jgi:hypothetical protein